MMNGSSQCCHRFALRSTHQCNCYHCKESCCFCRCYCSSQVSPSIQETFNWIIIGSFIYLIYSTIKLFLLILSICSLIYWLQQRVPIIELVQRFLEQINQSNIPIVKPIKLFLRQICSITKRATDSRTPVDHVQDNIIDSLLNPSSILESQLSSSSKDDGNDRKSFSTNLFSHEIDRQSSMQIENSSFNDGELIIDIQPQQRVLTNTSHSNNEQLMSLPKTKQKRSFTRRTEDMNLSNKPLVTTPGTISSEINQQQIHYETSISQPGYYGPIQTVNRNMPRKPSQMMNHLTNNSQMISMDFIGFCDQSSVVGHGDVDIRKKMIEWPQFWFRDNTKITDILTETKEIREAIANLHTDILRKERDEQSHSQPVSIVETENEILRETLEKTNDQLDLSNYNGKIKREKMQRKTTILYCSKSNLDSEALTVADSPQCLPIQISLETSSSMPRVPTNATFIAPDDENLQNNRSINSESELFENLPMVQDRMRDGRLLIELYDYCFKPPDRFLLNDHENDWIDYCARHDAFATNIQADLPVIYDDDGHGSFRKKILSHFHHRPKLINNHHAVLPQITLSTAENTENWIPTISDPMSNQLSQRIFRVRKSRIFSSFHNPEEDQHVFDTAADYQSGDRRSIIHYRNNNEQETKISDASILSLVRSFDSLIRQAQAAVDSEPTVICLSLNDDDEDELSDGTVSLYSVPSEPVFI